MTDSNNRVVFKIGCGPPLILGATLVLVVAKVLGASFPWWVVAVPLLVGVGVPVLAFVVVSFIGFVILLTMPALDRREQKRLNRLRNRQRWQDIKRGKRLDKSEARKSKPMGRQ